jgi:hypothetical protein
MLTLSTVWPEPGLREQPPSHGHGGPARPRPWRRPGAARPRPAWLAPLPAPRRRSAQRAPPPLPSAWPAVVARRAPPSPPARAPARPRLAGPARLAFGVSGPPCCAARRAPPPGVASSPRPAFRPARLALPARARDHGAPAPACSPARPDVCPASSRRVRAALRACSRSARRLGTTRRALVCPWTCPSTPPPLYFMRANHVVHVNKIGNSI